MSVGDLAVEPDRHTVLPQRLGNSNPRIFAEFVHIELCLAQLYQCRCRRAGEGRWRWVRDGDTKRVGDPLRTSFDLRKDLWRISLRRIEGNREAPGSGALDLARARQHRR